MIEATKLCKHYENAGEVTTVLRDVSLTVAEAEFLYLVGPSGSGKSTLLSILGCVLSPNSGNLSVLGADVSAMSPAELTLFRREYLGFVFQRFHLFRGLTATENVRVPLDLRGVNKQIGNRRARELLEEVGLGEKLNSEITRLSMGQRQRVAVARALVGSPRVVFADEPTASLDAESGLKTVELLRGLAKEKKTTAVVVTHDSRIFGYADRILKLEAGRLHPESASTANTAFIPATPPPVAPRTGASI